MKSGTAGGHSLGRQWLAVSIIGIADKRVRHIVRTHNKTDHLACFITELAACPVLEGETPLETAGPRSESFAGTLPVEEVPSHCSARPTVNQPPPNLPRGDPKI